MKKTDQRRISARGFKNIFSKDCLYFFKRINSKYAVILIWIERQHLINGEGGTARGRHPDLIRSGLSKEITCIAPGGQIGRNQFAIRITSSAGASGEAFII